MDYKQHAETARNPLAVPKQNFVISPEPHFDNANCSDDQTRLFSTRPVSDLGVAGQERGVKWFTKCKSIMMILSSFTRGFETKSRHNALIA
jgi:hypothetical protein